MIILKSWGLHFCTFYHVNESFCRHFLPFYPPSSNLLPPSATPPFYPPQLPHLPPLSCIKCRSECSTYFRHNHLGPCVVWKLSFFHGLDGKTWPMKLIHWKCNFPMTQPVGRLVGRRVCHNCLLQNFWFWGISKGLRSSWGWGVGCCRGVGGRSYQLSYPLNLFVFIWNPDQNKHEYFVCLAGLCWALHIVIAVEGGGGVSRPPS